MSLQNKNQGFSLVELAMVLLIVGILIAGMVSGFARYISQSRIHRAQEDLKMIEEALIGYVITNQYFPCPDIDGYPPAGAVPPTGTENRLFAAGICDNAPGFPNEIGYLPAADLGVPALDPWGNRYYYAVDSDYSDTGAPSFQINPPAGQTPDIEVRNLEPGSAGSTLIANNIVVFIYSLGKDFDFAAPPVWIDEYENINGDNVFVSKNFVPRGTARAFDDISRWISAPYLISKMVQAERLP